MGRTISSSCSLLSRLPGPAAPPSRPWRPYACRAFSVTSSSEPVELRQNTHAHTHTVQPTTHHLKIHLASSYSNFQKSHTCLSLCLFRESGAAFTPRLFEAMNHGHIIKLQWADTSIIKRTGGNIFGVFALSISHALLTSLCLSCL